MKIHSYSRHFARNPLALSKVYTATLGVYITCDVNSKIHFYFKTRDKIKLERKMYHWIYIASNVRT